MNTSEVAVGKSLYENRLIIRRVVADASPLSQFISFLRGDEKKMSNEKSVKLNHSPKLDDSTSLYSQRKVIRMRIGSEYRNFWNFKRRFEPRGLTDRTFRLSF